MLIKYKNNNFYSQAWLKSTVFSFCLNEVKSLVILMS